MKGSSVKLGEEGRRSIFPVTVLSKVIGLREGKGVGLETHWCLRGGSTSKEGVAAKPLCKRYLGR